MNSQPTQKRFSTVSGVENAKSLLEAEEGGREWDSWVRLQEFQVSHTRHESREKGANVS